MSLLRRIVIKAFEWLIGLFNLGRKLLALLNQYVIAPIKQHVLVMQAVANYECFITANSLKSMSPVASGLLARSWKVTANVMKQNGSNVVKVRITNSAPNAIFRIVGRAPGVMPPVAAISSWCKLKGIDPALAYPIARNIGTHGTHRWRTESNVLNYSRTAGAFLEPNVWSETIARIESKLRV